MPYDFHWQDKDETIIRIEVQKNVTWDEWHHLIDVICIHLAKKSHRVDIIIQDKFGMPAGNPIGHLKTSSIQLRQHKNLGLILSVTTPSRSFLISTLINTVVRIMNIPDDDRSHFVNNLDDAIKLIERDRAK